jgi:hypothetical protein
VIFTAIFASGLRSWDVAVLDQPWHAPGRDDAFHEFSAALASDLRMASKTRASRA